MPIHTTSSSVDAAAARAALEEHRQLRAAVDTLEMALTSPPRTGADPWRMDLARRLEGLHATLTTHFATEEARHLFEAIEDAWPSATSACRRLRAEHRRLLTDLGGLRVEVERTGEDRATHRVWVHRTRALLALLADHEERENALLLEAVEPGEEAQD